MLSGGAPIPLMRVIITVTINGTPEVLIDGVMTQYEIQPGSDASHATLIVKGKDLTAVMDYIEFKIPYPAMPAEARVAAMLAKYVMFGIIPMIVPSILINVPIPVFRIPSQRGTDLIISSGSPDGSAMSFISKLDRTSEPVRPIGGPKSKSARLSRR